MKTLALLSLSLTVVLGIPPFQMDVAQKPVLPRGDRSPVFGDWVPVQGHVVVEEIVPQFGLRPMGQEKAPMVPAEKVEQSPLVDNNPKPEDGTPVVQQKPEVQEPSEVNVRPEGQVQVDPAAEVLVEPEVQVDPDVQVEPEVHMEPDVLVEPEVHMEPDVHIKTDVQVDPDVHMEPDVLVEQEVHMEPDVLVQPEAHMEPDVQVYPDVHMEPDVQVQVEQEVQIDPELELELTMSEQLQKQEEALVMEGEHIMVEEPIMELEPLAEDTLNGKELSQEELSSEELALRAEFQNELVEEPVMELEPLTEEEGLLHKREYVMAVDPVMQLEPEMSEERFEDHPIMPDSSMMEEEPVLELMGEQNAVLEGEYFLAEEPIMELEPLTEEEGLLHKREYVIAEEPVMELEPEMSEERFEDDPIMPDSAMMEEEPVLQLMGEQNAVLDGEYFLAEEPIMELEPKIQQVPYPMAKLNTVIAEEPVMELEPLEEMVPVVGRSLYQQTVMGDGPVLDGGAHIGVEPEMEKRVLVEEGVNNELQPEQDHRATRRSTCTGVVLEGKCYEFFRGPRQAADAEFFCQDHFPLGHLASITSSYIHRQVMHMMLQQNGAYTRTWVGGLRYLETGRFIWLDGSRWSYADWLQGEPNNTADVEDCVELLAAGNGKFNDMPCWDLRAFICSYPF